MNLLKSREAADVDTSLETAVEGEIREFVRRDFASVRRPPENDGEAVANNISSLLQRVSGSSVQEIDRLIGELQTLRDMLHSEGSGKSSNTPTSARRRCSRPRSSRRA